MSKKPKRTYAQKQQLLIQQRTAPEYADTGKSPAFDVNEMTIGRMQVQQRYLLALNATIDEVQNKMFHVKQELAESLSVVVEAQQERKIVEKLREKQFAEYIYEEQLEEQKQLDEFGNRALLLKELMVLVIRRPWFQSIS